MGHTHRFYARNAPAIWALEGRWMFRLGAMRNPAAVQWIATRACNLQCSHCYSRAGRKAASELTTAEALALVDELVAMGRPTLVLAGGEPLLRGDITKIVDYAAERAVPWALQTHGGLVPTHLDLFKRFPPKLVAISLDGPEGVHDKFRGRSGSYRDALAAIDLLRSDTDCPEVVAGTTVTSMNADLLAEMFDVVAGSGAHGWGLHLFVPEGRGAEHRALVPTSQQLRRVAAFARRRRRVIDVDLDDEWGSAGAEDPFYREQPFLCGAGRFTCVVGADGEVFPCTTNDPEESEGNVRQSPLRDIWATGFHRFRSSGPCSDGSECWLQTRTNGPCRRQIFGGREVPAPVVAENSARRARPLPRPLRRPVRGLLRVVAAAGVALATVQPSARAGDEAEQPAPSSSPSAFPQDVDVAIWATWHRELFADDDRAPYSAQVWKGLMTAATTGSDVQVAMSRAEGRVPQGILSVIAGEPVDIAGLREALESAEKLHLWDGWLVGLIWRASGPVKNPDAVALAGLYGDLERHARVADALVLARAETGPVHFEPWIKKSSAPRDYRAVTVGGDLLGVAGRHFAAGKSGTWREEAVIDLTVSKGSVTAHRQGAKVVLDEGDHLSLGRLDVVIAKGDASLSHSELGVLSLQPKGVITAWNLAQLLSDAGKERIGSHVRAALGGDSGAIDALTPLLPAAHPQIRAALAEKPDAPGVGALRTLLVLFDE